MTTRDGFRPKVLYVLGSQRGGSTIVGRVLGCQPGFAFAGEVRRLWARGIEPGRTCGCGRTFDACPVWSEVLPRVLVDGADAIAGWQREVAPQVHSWRHAERILRLRRPWPALERYREAMGRMYSAMAATLDARVLIDTSKLPADAAVLTGIPEVEPYLLQLVRDPRGVVHSQLGRRGGQAGLRGPNAVAAGGRRQVVYLSAAWMARHVAARRLTTRRPEVPWLRVRYEDVVADPAGSLARIVRFVGEEPAPVPASGEWDLDEVHTAGGSLPARTGVTLEHDNRWESSLPGFERSVVTAATLPWLLRFGYPVGRGSATTASGIRRRPVEGEANR